MVNAQEWLDINYPLNDTCQRQDDQENFGKRRNEIIILGIDNKDLTGQLDLREFTNLETLDCSFNQLTKLCIKDSNKLREIYCNNNLITSFDYSVLNPQHLTYLNISSNNLPEQDCSAFGGLFNLKFLHIGNWEEEKINKNQYNRFYDSLVFLKNLTKLKRLDISNTKIDKGLEHLPESLELIYCEGCPLVKQLKNCKKGNLNFVWYEYQNWRKENQELLNNAQNITELESILTNLSLALNNQNLSEVINKTLQIFIFETEEKIKELKEINQEYYEIKIQVPPKH